MKATWSNPARNQVGESSLWVTGAAVLPDESIWVGTKLCIFCTRGRVVLHVGLRSNGVANSSAVAPRALIRAVVRLGGAV